MPLHVIIPCLQCRMAPNGTYRDPRHHLCHWSQGRNAEVAHRQGQSCLWPRRSKCWNGLYTGTALKRQTDRQTDSFDLVTLGVCVAVGPRARRARSPQAPASAERCDTRAGGLFFFPGPSCRRPISCPHAPREPRRKTCHAITPCVPYRDRQRKNWSSRFLSYAACGSGWCSAGPMVKTPPCNPDEKLSEDASSARVPGLAAVVVAAAASSCGACGDIEAEAVRFRC